MDQQTRSLKPNYKRIYLDILNEKQSLKNKECSEILSKENMSAIDVLALNKIIFDEKKINAKYRSYSKDDIIEILNYQKEYNMNNVELSNHFKISRNTIAKWKRIYCSLKYTRSSL